MPMLLQFPNERVGASLVFEDDGKTAYAYLIVDDLMVGDVWLYNVVKRPVLPEWDDGDTMPFANPDDYVAETDFRPIDDPSDVAVRWIVEHRALQGAVLLLRGEAHAAIRPGSKPGWCRLATKPNAIALPLSEVEPAG